MTAFGEMLRQLRAKQQVSLGSRAQMTHYNKGYLSKIERGLQRPTEDVARMCDSALKARGELIAAAHLDIAALRDAQPWQTTELLRRIQAGDTASCTLDALRATVTDLCCEYPYRDASALINDARDWLRHIAQVLRRPTGLREHRELLTCAGRLALLIACLEYDLGLRASAQATRAAARQRAQEAEDGEILAWTHEMASWFALTQRRYPDAVTESRAGQEGEALDRGRRLLDALPTPERPEHHFVVDPSKWVFYAMDAYRLAGDDALAEKYACQVLASSIGPGNVERAPMRIAEARLTLAVVAARRGDLEQATALGTSALRGPRKSLPSLLMVAR